MTFFLDLGHRRVTLDGSSAAPLTVAVERLTAIGPVRSMMVAVVACIPNAAGTPISVHVRALPRGGIEILATSGRAFSVGRFADESGVTVFTDEWQDGTGHCLFFRVLDGDGAQDIPVGVIERALDDAAFSGDAWALSANADAISVLAIDGLGHGPLAQNAAVAGVEAMRTTTSTSVADNLNRVHESLRGTVGAAAAVARLDRREKTVEFSGVGNIDATLLLGDRRARLISYPGVAGHGSIQTRVVRHVFTNGTHLVMHTDGVRSLWNPSNYPGLFFRHPALIAAVLFRDCGRTSDDAMILVVSLSPAARDALVNGSLGVQIPAAVGDT